MSENLEISYGIPSIEHIKALYNEVVPLLKQLKTKADQMKIMMWLKQSIFGTHLSVKYLAKNRYHPFTDSSVCL